jgi:hypothetical protein
LQCKHLADNGLVKIEVIFAAGDDGLGHDGSFFRLVEVVSAALFANRCTNYDPKLL